MAIRFFIHCTVLLSTFLSCAMQLSNELPAQETPLDQLPLGHPDFYPSPDRPIGWRGDGNGAFPGASLVNRFGDGRMQTVRVKDSRGKSKALHIAEDGGPINIAWKYTLPGWTMSQPIIVGDRVIQTCEPRSILCLELATGEKIWEQELCPFTMLGLSGKEREAALFWESAAWTLTAQRYANFGNYTRIYGKAEQAWPVMKKYAANIAKMLDRLEPYTPDMVQTARAGLVKANEVLAGPPSEGKKKELVKYLCEPAAAFVGPFQRQFGFPATAHWYSYVGWTWPTPVCDGTWLYVFMNQGQIAKLSLKDGSIVWLRRLSKTVRQLKQPLPRSPILHKGIVYMLADEALYALDADSGKELWSISKHAKSMSFNSDISAVGLCMVTLADGRTVLAHGKGGDQNELCLIDPMTGAILYKSEQFGKGRSEPGPSLMSEGNMLLFGNGGHAYRIRETDGKIEPHVVWSFKRWQSNVQVLHDGLYYSSHLGKPGFNIYDVNSGKAALPQPISGFTFSCYRPGILVGNHIIGSKQPHMYKPVKIQGQYRYTQHFTIYSKDGATRVADNILQIASADDHVPMPAPQAQRFLDEDLTSADIGSICAGIPPSFGWGGMYAHGKHLLIPSTRYLYCIAPALDGLPTEDPAVAKRIAKADDVRDLKPYLRAEQAHYRLAACKRLQQLDAAEVADELKHVILHDPYDEIRVSAVLALGEEGNALIREQIGKRWNWHARDERYGQLLSSMGDTLDPIIKPMLSADADKEQRLAAVCALITVGTAGPALRDVLITAAQEDADIQIKGKAATALGNWAVDDAVTTFFHAVINDPQEKYLQQGAFAYLSRAVEAESRIEFLKSAAANNPDRGVRQQSIRQLLEMQPRPSGLYEWFVKRAKSGDEQAVNSLPGLTGGEKDKLASVLLELLSVPRSLRASAAICLQYDIHAEVAMDALSKELEAIASGRGQSDFVRQLSGMVQRSRNGAIRVRAAALFARLLQEKDVRDRALDALRGLGHSSAAFVNAIKAVDTSGNPALAKKVASVIASIESRAAIKR